MNGFYGLGETLMGIFLTRNSSRAPKDADSAPTFRVYGNGEVLATGSLSQLDTGVITGATNASPIVITDTAHGLQTGNRVTITGVGGNTAANGEFTVTRINDNTFSLDGSTGNSAYTSGGTWHVTGLYEFELELDSGDGFEAGETYQALINWTISGTAYADTLSFTVT